MFGFNTMENAAKSDRSVVPESPKAASSEGKQTGRGD